MITKVENIEEYRIEIDHALEHIATIETHLGMIRLIALLPERNRQYAKPSLDAICLDVRKVLAVHTRCALVGAALGIGMGQDMSSRLILSYRA